MESFLFAIALFATLIFFVVIYDNYFKSTDNESEDGRSKNYHSNTSSSDSSSPERAYEEWTSKEEDYLVVWKAEGRSIEEIAGRLKRSESAVRSRIKQARRKFWTPDRARKLSKSAQDHSGVEEIAEDIGLPKPLVRRKMVELGLIGNNKTANLRSRLSDNTVKIRFWKAENRDLTGGTPSDCDAAWVPSQRYEVDDQELFLFSEGDATILGQLLKQLYGFDGEVTRSSSGKTWNIWSTPRSIFKRRLKRNRSDSTRSREGKGSDRRKGGGRKVSDDEMSRSMRKHPELRDMDHPEHWVRLSKELMIDPGVLKSNLD